MEEELDSDSADISSSEEEEEPEWTVEDEKDFLKTLSALKTREPEIYKSDIRFFNDEKNSSAGPVTEEKKKMKEGEKVKMSLKDYQRKLLLERDGHLSGEEEEEGNSEELLVQNKLIWNDQQLKEGFKQALDASDTDDNDSNGLLKKRVKTEDEEKKEQEDYYEWLRGEASLNVRDKNLQKLKERWGRDTELDEEERFLRDYLLYKKHESSEASEDKLMSSSSRCRIPTYEEIIEDDEVEDKADAFEQKFNFRFEEPDQEFLKQFPRTVKEALRDKDNPRKRKRSEQLEKKKAKKHVIEEVEMPFRYRSVVPNSFGLTTDEILNTDDSALNAWASINKTCQYRSVEEEKRQLKYFERKGSDMEKKRKILQKHSAAPPKKQANSVEEEKEMGKDEAENKNESKTEEAGGDDTIGSCDNVKYDEKPSTSSNGIARRKNKNGGPAMKKEQEKANAQPNAIERLGDERLNAYGVSRKKLKRAQYVKRMEMTKK